jgi:hypothetical protein
MDDWDTLEKGDRFDFDRCASKFSELIFSQSQIPLKFSEFVGAY